MAVSTSAERDDILVDVQNVYVIRLWTLISVSYELFSFLLYETVSGTSVQANPASTSR